mgnify:CR=1 FL=1
MIWIVGWLWTIGGLVGGAFLAQPLLQWADVTNSPYANAIGIGVAVVAGILVQLVGWALVVPATIFGAIAPGTPKVPEHADKDQIKVLLSDAGCWTATGMVMSTIVLDLVAILLPLVGVGYGIYAYLHWVGAGQASITVAFVGALLIKALVIPLIKAVVPGAAFKWFMDWLRGDKSKKQA